MAKKYLLTPNFVDRLAKMLAAYESKTDEVWFKPPEMGPPAADNVTFRQGKLDSSLAVGGSATVSIWKNSTTDSYLANVDETDGEDTGDNWEDCWAPLVQDSAIASGTFVTVMETGGERLVIMARCP